MIDWADMFFQYSLMVSFTGVIGIWILIAWYFKEKRKLRQK